MENKPGFKLLRRWVLVGFLVIVVGLSIVALYTLTDGNHMPPAERNAQASISQNSSDGVAQTDQQSAQLTSDVGRAAVTSFQQVTNMLEREYPDQALTSEEEQVLFYQLQSLGLIAHTNAVAYQYLIDGTEPSFWTAKRRWMSSWGNWSDGALANYAILALGLTKQNDVVELLEKLASREETVHPPRMLLRGAIVSARFYHQYRMTHDDNEVQRNLLEGRDSQLYQEWERTPEGKRWTAWFRKESR